MRSALLLPSQNALDQLSRFPRPSQERINYLVQEFRQQISNLMSLLVALRKVDLTHAVHCGITDEPQRIGHWLERIRKVQRFDKVIRLDSIFGIVDIANRFNAFVLVQLFDYLFPFRVRMNAAMRTNICAVTRRLK